MFSRILAVFMLSAVCASLITGCAASLKEVKVDKVELCEHGRCTALGNGVNADELLTRLHTLLNRNVDQDVVVAESDQQTRKFGSGGIKYYTQGGPLPFFVNINSLKFTDVTFLDREKREIKFKMRPWSSFLAVPVLCAEGEGVLTVNPPDDVSLEVSNLCTWMVIGSNSFQMKMRLDRIDLDAGRLSGYYSVGHAGVATFGKGSGYQTATFAVTGGFEQAKAADSEVVAQYANSQAVSKHFSAPVPESPELVYTSKFSDESRDGILDPGERIALTVEVINNGKGPAEAVKVVLSGTPGLVSVLGTFRDVGPIGSGGRATVAFDGVLPGKLYGDSAELKIAVIEGRGFVPAETRIIRFASRTSEHKETVQILSQTPRLLFSLVLSDENKNQILEAGEEISLVADIANQGEGKAEGVQLKLSGTKSLIDALGSSQPVGDITPGGRKRIELKSKMPATVSSENAELKVELSESRGFASAEARVLRVATRGVEIREVVNIISELSVDDIPPKVLNPDRSNDVALVIGISSYRESVIPQVKYARRDAEVMAKYIEHLSSVPASNIALLTDGNATKSDIEAYLDDWLPRRVTPSSRVFVYYAGHGAPDLTGKGAFIVPYEGHPDFATKLLPLEKMYESLNRLKAREVIVFLDSCFSGAKGRSVVQGGVRPLILTSERLQVTDGKVIVLASASGSEATSDFEQARHGLFTYYLLKGLRGEANQKGDGIVTLGELFEFVSRNVVKTASRELNRTQTPVMLPSSSSEILGMGVARTR